MLSRGTSRALLHLVQCEWRLNMRTDLTVVSGIYSQQILEVPFPVSSANVPLVCLSGNRRGIFVSD